MIVIGSLCVILLLFGLKIKDKGGNMDTIKKVFEEDHFKSDEAIVLDEVIDSEDIIDIYVERGNLKVTTNETNSCNVKIFMDRPEKLKKFDYYLNKSDQQLKFNFCLKQPAEIFNFYKNIDIIISIPSSYNKNLRINGKAVNVIADTMTMNSVKIDTVSGNIELYNLKTNEAKIATTSGYIYVPSLSEIDLLKLESVSGNVDLVVADLENSELNVSTISGKFKLDSEHIKERNYKKFAEDAKRVTFVKTVSGNINIKSK